MYTIPFSGICFTLLQNTKFMLLTCNNSISHIVTPPPPRSEVRLYVCLIFMFINTLTLVGIVEEKCEFSCEFFFNKDKLPCYETIL